MSVLLGCSCGLAVYHEQKYTVSQHLKIGRYGHAIVCKLQYYASAYTGACLKFVTWIDTSLRLMDCSIFPLLLLSSSLDSLGHSVPPVQYIRICEGRWLSCHPGSVAEHWWLKPEVYWVQLLAAASLFTFLYFHLITCRFLQATVLCQGLYCLLES